MSKTTKATAQPSGRNKAGAQKADAAVSLVAETRQGSAPGVPGDDPTSLGQAELYRAVGRIEAAHFLETVSSRMIGEAYLTARTLIGKLGAVTVPGTAGGMKRVSSLEEFCDAVMPVSHRRCRQIAQAMHTLGTDLFEQAEQMGLGHRNYVAIRALPHDMQGEVKAAIASGDKDRVLTVLEELAVRNASLQADGDDLRNTLLARQKVVDQRNLKIAALEEQVTKLQSPPPTDADGQLKVLQQVTVSVQLALDRAVNVIDDVMASPATAAIDKAARNTIDYLAQFLKDQARRRGIALQLDDPVLLPHMATFTAAKPRDA